jgi:hypothetical protein
MRVLSAERMVLSAKSEVVWDFMFFEPLKLFVLRISCFEFEFLASPSTSLRTCFAPLHEIIVPILVW